MTNYTDDSMAVFHPAVVIIESEFNTVASHECNYTDTFFMLPGLT